MGMSYELHIERKQEALDSSFELSILSEVAIGDELLLLGWLLPCDILFPGECIT